MKIENEHTFKKALEQGINLFTGSGFSVLAQDAEGKTLPPGGEFAKELIDFFEIPHRAELTLGQVCTILNYSHKNELYAYLKKRFSVKEFDPLYFSLDHVNIKNIFTTNIDDLLFQVYAQSMIHYLNDLDIKGPVLHDREAINIVTLHGCVLDDTRDLSFSSMDIAAAFHADPDRWYSLTQRLQSYPTLFWGTSINDSSTLEALNPKTIQLRPQKDKWVVLPDDTDYDSVQYFKALDCHLIIATTSEMLNYIKSLDIITYPTKSELRKLPTKKLFPLESIPDIGTIPSRPIIEFYLGAAPQWSDIFSGQLYRTSHFDTVVDSINSGKDTIVVGMTACGKTTLMMQVAQDIAFNGHKLILESPSIEKARLISNILGDTKALIFVDNFADSADSFQFFIEQPNTLAVGFDREYNFEMVSDRIECNKCNIVEVTEINKADVQEIISRIPKNIRSPYIQTEGITEGPSPSLFELIEFNITMPSLAERFQSVIEKFSSQEKNLLDLLLVSCYVHACRTPVSMDLLLAFFRGIADDYKDIYKMCDYLKPMIYEYYGELADEEQDYWMPRSTIVSETILSHAYSSSLKRMLLRFYKQVSPSRIPKYNIFRRKAHDSRLISRAFLDWHEGKQFYETVYQRENDYYVLQQGAIYLSHKRRFKEAFNWIEKAITLSGGKNLSIQNSHAIILFRANIGFPSDDSTVKNSLNQSMEILSQCYTQDKRKTYHALTFADHAMQYWNVYANNVAFKYLETAKNWLEEERKNTPWSFKVKRLLTQVSNMLRRGKP